MVAVVMGGQREGVSSAARRRGTRVRRRVKEKSKLTVSGKSIICKSGVYLKLFTWAQKTGALPRICTKLNLSLPSTPKLVDESGELLTSDTSEGSLSRRTICSVST